MSEVGAIVAPGRTQTAGEVKEAAAQVEAAKAEETRMAGIKAALFPPREQPEEADESPEEAEQPEAQPDEGQPEEVTSESDTDGAKDPDLDVAFKGLLEAGMPVEVLKGASKATLRKWWDKQAKREADIRLAFQERADLQKKLKDQPEATKGTEPSSGAPTDTPLDLGDALKPIVEFYPELETPLKAFAEKLIALTETRVAQKYGGEIQTLASNSGAATELIVERTMDKLGESFPALKTDAAKREAVLKKMQMLGATGAYSELPTVSARAESCMEDACRLVFKDEAESLERQRKSEVSRSRSNGQPIVRTSRQPGRPMTEEARQKAIFEISVGKRQASDEEIARLSQPVS